MKMRDSLWICMLFLQKELVVTAQDEPDRSEAPKTYRENFPISIKQLVEHAHSQLEHRPNDIQVEPRIVGGSDAGANTYPFYVRVDTMGYPYCGGSLVAPDLVLTAAHCHTSDNDLSVVVNGYDLYSGGTALSSNQFERRIEYSIRHPEFDSTTFDNDAMLLKLDSLVETEPVLLNFDSDTPEAGDDLIVMGLGHKFEDGAPASTLQVATVQAVDDDICKANYQSVGLDRLKEEIMLCAGNLEDGMKDACQGDSGGPLIDGTGSLVGIVSWGVGCGRKDLPGVYCRVSGIKDWLSQNICTVSDEPPFWCENMALINDDGPTASPTIEPTTPSPTNQPTARPTEQPSFAPVTPQPTPIPTESPTGAPVTPSPTDEPTIQQSPRPTRSPTAPPTPPPTFKQTQSPTNAPTIPTQQPTIEPTSSATPGFSQSPSYEDQTTSETPSGQTPSEPTPSITLSPTTAQTSLPTVLSTSPTTETSSPTMIDMREPRLCKDHGDLFESGNLRGGKQTCEWLRDSHEDIIEFYCIPGTDAWNVCEETCGKCNDECVNSDSALFAVEDDSELRNCAWLDFEQAMQMKLCVAGNDAYVFCERACGSCAALSRNSEIHEDVRNAFYESPPMVQRKDPFGT